VNGVVDFANQGNKTEQGGRSRRLDDEYGGVGTCVLGVVGQNQGAVL
jgi:hypothetical protein